MADVLSVIADIIKQDKQQKREHAKVMREVQKKLKEKEADAEEKSAEPAPNLPLPEGITIPGVPGASIPGVETVEPTTDEKDSGDPETEPEEEDSE